MLVRSCFLITLIKCLKGHKSVGSLCNVKSKSYWVSQWVSQWQGHLLSCCGQLKISEQCETVSLCPCVVMIFENGNVFSIGHGQTTEKEYLHEILRHFHKYNIKKAIHNRKIPIKRNIILATFEQCTLCNAQCYITETILPHLKQMIILEFRF